MEGMPKWRWLRGLFAACILATAVVTVGCEKGPKEQLRTAQAAVLAEKPDVAEDNLKAVLKADPDNVEARRLMAQVHKLRDQYAKAEEELNKLWADLGFDKEGAELSTEQRRQEQLIRDDFTELYREWAEAIDPKENPEKYEEVLRSGLKFDEKNPRLNSMLVEFYELRGEKLVEQGKKAEAADVFEKILELRTLPQKREQATERASNLRFEAHRDKALAYFNEKAKPKLIEQERWDEEAKAVVLSVEKDMPRGFNPKNEEQVGAARQAMFAELAGELQKIIVDATGISADANFKVLNRPSNLQMLQENVVDEEVDRRDYTLTAKLPIEQVLKLGYEVREATRKAEEKAKEAAAAGEQEPAEAGEAPAEGDGEQGEAPAADEPAE